MDSHIHKSVENYLKIYTELHKKLKWKVNSQLSMMISLLYVINDKPFVLDEFLEVSNYIKNETDIFSPLHSHQRFSTAAMLITKYENPKDKFHELLKYQKKLIEGGFKKGTYTAISALSLMTTYNDTQDLDQRISKAMKIYKGMKSNHFFLTSQGDYPLAILLSESDLKVDSLTEEVEFYYSELADSNFKKGNDLQFLSHILMLTNTENKSLIINRCNNLYDSLVNEGLKIRRMHYPQIGLMSIIDKELDEEISHIKNITDKFNKTVNLKFDKNINFIMATLLVISKVIKNLYDDITIIETGINTSIEALIQAQNAALIASVAATSAATTTATT